MNATSLYVSTCRLVLQANAEDSASWLDLFRLLPYLRQSLSCTVCGNLLIEPYTPTETNCQHHVCKACKGGKKKLKPSCSWCKDYEKYVENVQLRILLQCYKKLCEYITSTIIFKKLSHTSSPTNNVNANSLDGTSHTLINLIQEGSGFADEFRSSASGRSNFNITPFVHTITTSTQTSLGSTSLLTPEDSTTVNPSSINGDTNTPSDSSRETSKPLHNGSSTYSVQYAGSGNKLTIKRKPSDLSDDTNVLSKKTRSSFSPSMIKSIQCKNQAPVNSLAKYVKKQPKAGKSNLPGAVKTGCRCGNATATPGKLTCCGQRCACYTESKPCVDCKCRGCRNPHTADGQKIWPAYSLADEGCRPQTVVLTSDDMATASGGTVQVVGVYTTQLHNVASGSVILDAASVSVSDTTNEELGDIN